jgi:hypothetical protein
MKHAIPLIFILAVLCGCATKPAAVAEQNYEELFLKEILHIVSWLDTVRSVSDDVETARVVSRALFDAYPNDADITEIALDIAKFSADIHTKAMDIDTTVSSYMRAHENYLKNSTSQQAEELYQHLSDIITDIDRWYSYVALWDRIFERLETTMNRYNIYNSML